MRINTAANSMRQVSTRDRRKRHVLFVSQVLAVCYVLFLPAGWIGGYMVLTSLLIGFLALNRATLIAYLLLFGTMTFGAIAVVIGFPGFGGKVAGILGVLLAFVDRRFWSTRVDFKRSALWAVWIGLVLTLWFFLGPQTSYSKSLLWGYFINTPLLFVGFLYLLLNRSVNWTALGQLAIISSLAVLAFEVIIRPSFLPSNLFDFSVLRQKVEGVYAISSHDLAYMATMGVLMIVFAMPDRMLRRRESLFDGVSLMLGVLVLGWTFHRTSLLAFAFAIAMSSFLRPRYKRRYRTVMVTSLIAVAAIIIVTSKNDATVVTSVLDTNASVTSRLNRSTNWDAALYCIEQKPWFGHGLGGYYIPGFTRPGERSSAHNLFLGLLSDLGIIGTVMIFFPLIPMWWSVRKKVSWALRSANGGALMPVLMPAFFVTMASGNISSQASFLVIIVLLAENWPKAGQIMLPIKHAI